MLDDEDQLARAALRVLQDVAETDEKLGNALAQLMAPTGGDPTRLRDWLAETANGAQGHPALANYVSGGHIDKLVTIARAGTVNVVAGAPRKSLFGLPRAIADFTGREADVAELTALLDEPHGAPRGVVIAAIAGKPGVGKSTLALHVAHCVADRYPYAALYANLRGAQPQRLSAASVLEGFLRDLGLSGNEIPEGVDRRSSVFRAQLHGRRALVVLDNAHNEAQVRPLLPGSATCAVIITSRSPLGGLEDARLRPLDVLGPSSAVELLGKLIGSDRIADESEAAARIVLLCGGLPLALRIAGGLLAQHPTARLEGLARRLADERRRLDELRLGDLEVRASFALSYDSLDAEAARLFRRLSVLTGPDFGSEVVAALNDDDAAVTERVLIRLAHSQLLDAPAANRYRFHDLIAVFARERATAQESGDALDVVAARARHWYLGQANAAAGITDSEAHRPTVGLREPERHDPTRWFALERANIVAAVEQAHDAGDWVTTHQLVLGIEHHLSLAHWDEWQKVHELGLDAARRAGDTHSEAQSLGGLGCVYFERGRCEEAIECHEQAAEMLRVLDDPQCEAVALGQLGSDYGAVGRWDDAIACLTQSIDLLGEIGDRLGEAQTRANLATVYVDRGSWDDAIDCFGESIRTMRELGDALGEAKALGNLGTVHSRQGRWQDAIACHDRCAAITRSLGDLHGEAHTAVHIGIVYEDQGRWAEAAERFQWSLETMRRLGDRHGEAVALANVGRMHSKSARWDDAIRCLRLSLALTRELGDAQGEAQTLALIGGIHADQARWDEAVACYLHSLRMMQDLGDRAGEAETVGGLGGVYAEQGYWDQAISCFERSLQTMRDLGNSKGEAQMLGNLGILYLDLGRWDDAVSYHEQSVRMMRKLGDPQGEAAALNNLGNAFRVQGRAEDAISCYERSVQAKRDVADTHGEAQTMINLANAYSDQSRWDDAIACYQQSLQTMRHLKDQRGEAQALGNLGNAYSEQARWAEAARCQKQCLDTMRELGDRQGEAYALGNLANVYTAQGRETEAIDCFEQVLRTARDMGDRYSEAGVLLNLGAMAGESGAKDEAVGYLTLAHAIFDDLGARETATAKALLDQASRARTAYTGPKSAPHSLADPQGAAALNKLFIDDLARWTALPWMKRRLTKRPQRPEGI